jgi:PIN domain nuclease of toxin-antitoxin system
MIEALLLDTHIALWLDSGNERLLANTRSRIDDCRRDDGTVFLSAVSLWEIALLVDNGRVRLDVPVDEWVDRLLKRAGLEGAPLELRAAARSYQLSHLPHRDPADRLLIATAIELGCPLVTYDERILDFGMRHGTQYRFLAIRE